MKRLTEMNEYEHKGIKIVVYIDHNLGKISLMEKDTIRSNELITFFKKKEWNFSTRGLEYMKGWQDILDAMKYAVGEATKLLEHDLAESSKFKENMDRNVILENYGKMQNFKLLRFGMNDEVAFNRPKKRKKK